MGGPIIKKLADGVVINGTTHEYFIKTDGRRQLRVHCAFGAGGSVDMEVQVLPVVPTVAGGPFTAQWGDFGGSDTLPYVTPTQGLHDLGGSASSGVGIVFVGENAITSQMRVTVQNKTSADAGYDLVAELL